MIILDNTFDALVKLADKNYENFSSYTGTGLLNECKSVAFLLSLNSSGIFENPCQQKSET